MNFVFNSKSDCVLIAAVHENTIILDGVFFVVGLSVNVAIFVCLAIIVE